VSEMDEAKGRLRRRQRCTFTDEHKAQTVKLVLSGHKTAGKEELARGRKEVRTLRMEREILKDAAACFAKGNK
jgi:transposase-like protein